MRKTLLMLVVMAGMAGAQIASAQNQMGSEAPLQAATPSVAGAVSAMSPATSSDANHGGTIAMTPNANADPAANPTVKEDNAKNATTTKQDDTSKMRPDDPRKSPYWEPRDWNYISQQGS